MAAFERLQDLGEEKFGKILNLLMRGEPAMGLARTIQQAPPQGWGEFQDVAEKTLTQQLNRLRHVAARGAFGKNAAKAIIAGATPHIDKLAHISVQALDRIEILSEKQHTLVMVLLDKAIEEKRTFKSVNDAVNNYRQTLLDIQKMRFDLGLDEWKGPISQTVRGAIQNTTLPDGTLIQKAVFEAVRTVEQIFDQRQIPAPAQK